MDLGREGRVLVDFAENRKMIAKQIQISLHEFSFYKKRTVINLCLNKSKNHISPFKTRGKYLKYILGELAFHWIVQLL